MDKDKLDVTRVRSKKVSCDGCGRLFYFSKLKRLAGFGGSNVCRGCYDK